MSQYDLDCIAWELSITVASWIGRLSPLHVRIWAVLGKALQVSTYHIVN